MTIHSTKYHKKYHQIIKHYRLLGLEKDKETEIHHIIPKCIGGTNDASNLIRIPTRIHFILHWMLVKIYQHPKLIYAFNIMCTTGNKYHSRPKSSSYKYARNYVSTIMKTNNPNKDGKHSKLAWEKSSTERRQKQSAIMSNINKLHKTKPKEIRQYQCKRCGINITRLEFIHHTPKSRYYCTKICKNPNTIHVD